LRVIVKTWTFSCWFKGNTTSTSLFSCESGGPQTSISFQSDDTFEVYGYTGGYDFRLLTTAVYRDPSAWYHVVVAVDTPLATASNRVKIYINGTQVTDFGTATYPSQNYDTGINASGVAQFMGKGPAAGGYFNGLMALPILVDGAALDATSFGEEDDDGYWNPIEFAGDYNVLGSTPTVSSASALWTGNTATWTFTDDDISGPTGTDAAIRIMDYAFSDDFSVQWTHRAAINSSYTIGVYPTASDASFNAATYYAGVFYSPGLATSFSLRFDSETTYSLWGGNSAEQSSLAAADNDVMKFERVGSTFKVYKNAALIRTMTFTSTSQMRIALGRGAVCDMENVTFDYEIVDGVSGGAYDFADSSWFGLNVAGNDDQTALSAATPSATAWLNITGAWTMGSGTASRTTTVNAIRSASVFTGDFSLAVTMASGATGARVGVYAANEDGTFVSSGDDNAGLNSMTNSFYANFGAGTFYKGASPTVGVSQTNGAITITRVSGTITINTAGGSHTFAATYTGPMRLVIGGGATTMSYTGIAYTADGQAGNSFFDTGFVAADQVSDTPTDDVDLEIGNFVTLNPNQSGSGIVLYEGNTKYIASTANRAILGTFGFSSGKYYWEVTVDTITNLFGIDDGTQSLTEYPAQATGNNLGARCFYPDAGYKYNGAASSAVFGNSCIAGEIVGVAVDMDNGAIWISTQGVWQDTGGGEGSTSNADIAAYNATAVTNAMFTGLTSLGTIFPLFGPASSSQTLTINFGQKAFAYTPPTGFVALATQNLADTSPLYAPPPAQLRAGTQVQSDALGSDSIGGATQSMRVVIPASAIADQSATRVRLKLKAASSQAFDTSHLYFGTNATGGSNAWDFTGDQVQVSVNGSTTISVAAGTSVYSDWFTFACDGTDPLCAAWLFAATGGGTAYAATSGYTRYYKVSGTSSTDASATSPSGFTAQSNYFMLIAAIEVQ
jgi:hypothetical protein